MDSSSVMSRIVMTTIGRKCDDDDDAIEFEKKRW
jgi:hypothetical protein